MTREWQKVIAVVLMVVAALNAYFLQPGNLAVFGDPKTVAVILGAVGVVVPIVTNVLPSLFNTNQDPPPPAVPHG